LTSAGNTDGYVVKLTSAGNLDSNLVRRFGGIAADTASGVALAQGDQNIVITGSYVNTANFDPGGTNTSLTSPVANQSDAFALELSSNLGFKFIGRIGLAGSVGNAVGADSQGSVYITGSQPTAGGANAFLAKFNSVGTLVSDRLFGGPASGGTLAIGTGLVVDGPGNVYVDGYFMGTGVNFNKFNMPGTVALDSAGGLDAFLIKVDSSNDLIWARRFGSSTNDVATALAIDGSGNLYATGYETGQSSFGTTGPGTMVLDTGNGMNHAFNAYVLEVDNAGNFVQATGAAGTGTSAPTSIAANTAGEIAITGGYAAPATFGMTTLPSLGPGQFFVATLNANTGGGGNGGGNGNNNHNGGGGMSDPPTFVGEMRITVGKGKHKKVVGFERLFSSALDGGNAMNVGHYHVTQPGKKGNLNVVPVLAANYNPGTFAVTLTLGGFNQKKPLQLTASGLTGMGGTPVATIVTNL
jgi:hypothetical protein